MKVIKHTLVLTALAIAAVVLGWGWFALSLSYGWPPLPPSFLPQMIGADGEGFYDAYADQLALALFSAFALGYLGLAWWRRR